MKKNGFTLIELLVVIAIIGILAGIVLVSVGTARNKAKDVAVKADLSNMRAAAEMYNDRVGSYGGFCADTGSDGGARSMTAINDVNGAGDADCNDSATAPSAWAACGDLVAGTAPTAWCVDSLGNSKEMANATCVAAWVATVCL